MKTKTFNDSGASYNTEDVGGRQERVDVRARASLQALNRGDSGCAMSPVEMARAMAGLLRMHQSEFEMQVHMIRHIASRVLYSETIGGL